MTVLQGHRHQRVSFLLGLFVTLLSSTAVASDSFLVDIVTEDSQNISTVATTRNLRMSSTSDFPSLLLAAVNNERAAHGLPPLCMNTKLQSAAQKHSDDMAKNNFLSRIGSSGSLTSHRITASGFQWSAIAENVFAGQKDVVAVMNWLKRSADYEKNILSTTYKMFGCGYAYNPKSTHKNFWTLYFALGSSESCSTPVTFNWQAPTTQTEILTNKKPTPVIKMPTPAIELPAIQQPAMETPTSTNKAPILTHSGSIHKKMLSAVNKQRVAVGLRPLCMNAKLQSAAQGHSNDMASNNFMGHGGTDGSTMSQRISRAGYEWSSVRENVAAGQTNVNAVMEAWMNSEGHRTNILDPETTMFGCAYAYNGHTMYKHFWTQDFGSSDTELCSTYE